MKLIIRVLLLCALVAPVAGCSNSQSTAPPPSVAAQIAQAPHTIDAQIEQIQSSKMPEFLKQQQIQQLRFEQGAAQKQKIQ